MRKQTAAWLFLLLALMTLVIPQPVFGQPLFFWELPPEEQEESSSSAAEVVVVETSDLTTARVSSDLHVKYNMPYSSMHCDSGPKEEVIHMITYTDSAGNTVKIYCQWNPWIPEGTRQFIAFYNDMTVVGLCPYDHASNRHEVHTDEETGEIKRTHWLSVRANGSDYTVYNNLFG